MKSCKVLYFHGIRIDCPRLNSSPARLWPHVKEFEQIIQDIKRRYVLIGIPELVEALRKGITLPSKTLCITFDDGYKNNLSAVEILSKYKVPVTVFVSTEFVDGKSIPWFVRVDAYPELMRRPYNLLTDKGHIIIAQNNWRMVRARLKNYLLGLGSKEMQECLNKIESHMGISLESIKENMSEFNYLSWSDLKQMYDNGVTIGSHCHSHIGVSGLNYEEKNRELVNSRLLLKQNVGVNAGEYLSYPDGRYDVQYKDIAARNYQAAFGVRTKTRWDDLYALPRYSTSCNPLREISTRYQLYRMGVSLIKKCFGIGNNI